jgi:hypothetical protein
MSATKYKSLYPPICLQGPVSNRWYIIAGGVWHKVKRKYSWKELESMWERIEYSQPKVVVSVKKQYIVPGSSGNEYTVTEDKGFWSCTCPAHGFGRGKDCKHIKQIKNI